MGVVSWMRSTPKLRKLFGTLKAYFAQADSTYKYPCPWPEIKLILPSIPGVRFAGLIHPGILGCAPSPEVLAEWNKREGELITACAHMDRDVALPPLPQNCHPGGATDAALKEKIGKEGARTVPGRPEHGGNCDIKNLSRGSKVYLPVHVKGAKFSVGDLHFSREFSALLSENLC